VDVMSSDPKGSLTEVSIGDKSIHEENMKTLGNMS
jgi:hypothetical protein